MSNNIYKRVANHVTALYESDPHPNLTFHNLVHTKAVVARAEEIAAHYQLSETDTLTVYIAAWFHDTGHMFAEMEHHEEKSVELMRAFMEKEDEGRAALVEAIAGCIMATRIPHQPKSQLEEIMCDADTYHFGTKDFKTSNKLIKKEFALRGYIAKTQDWVLNTVEFLEKHKFFTSYCQVLLEEGKRKNIERLRKKKSAVVSENTHKSLFDIDASSDEATQKERAGLLSKGVQTMFRLTSENHFRLSELADRKANLLISVNAIMISVILGFLVRRLVDSPHLTIPAVVFLVSSLSTIIIAILATRPRVTEGNFKRDDVVNKKTNLVFFGNFYKSTPEDYTWAVSRMMKDTEYLYSVLIRDIHQMGVVLARKYVYIRTAYTVFMVGLTLSVITFFVASIVQASNAPKTSTSSVKDATGSPF
ncbi:MAG: Pycsar system effector family protein [Bacteroidota bacterium]